LYNKTGERLLPSEWNLQHLVCTCSETIDEYPLLCLPTVPVICTGENKTSLVMEHGSKVCLLV